MATFKKNLYLQGASGMLGGQLVYKTVDGRTVVSSPPVRKSAFSEAQLKQMTRFKYVSAYAKAALVDEQLGPVYDEAFKRLKGFRSAYQLAVTDYLRPPEIGDLHLPNGSGGSKLLIEAFEDPKLNRVEFLILDDNGDIMERGDASIESNGIQWGYVLQSDIPEGGSVRVDVHDLPGNISSKTFEV